MKKVLISLLLLTSSTWSFAQSILMFASHEQTYYSEYIVMKEALEAAGYTVDVRSASTLDFSIYMSPYDDITDAANSLSGSTYSQFQTQFSELFGAVWDEATYDAIPSTAGVNGSIMEVADFSDYVGLVVVGGTGSLDFRVDGDYMTQGSGDRLISATDVQAAAEKLNALALQALQTGKPVMAQCHGASLPAFWRIPNTTGSGEEDLGFSFLKGGVSTGFPETETGPTLASLDITYRSNDRVTISNPHASLDDNNAGIGKILTTKNWYPQTVAYAARTFLNVLETYPKSYSRTSEVKVLVLHGGALDESDMPSSCSGGNKGNDVPCNNGITNEDLPADYTHLMELLTGSGAADDFDINGSELDLSGSLPFDLNTESEIVEEFENYDVVIFFKHWTTFMSDELQDALVTYADDGGGVLALHHGLYNDITSGQNKNILANELFGAHSARNTWSATLTNYDVYSTNYGHFISSYLIDYETAQADPVAWTANTLPTSASSPYSTLPVFQVYDELYNNMAFTGTIDLGRSVNDITPLFSNDRSTNSIAHTTAFTRKVDIDENGTVGRVAYFEIGERKEQVNSSSRFGQIVRNAVVWSANKESAMITWNGSTWSNGATPSLNETAVVAGDYSTAVNGNIEVAKLNIDFDANVTINTGGFIQVDQALTQNGNNFIVESGGSLLTNGSVSGSDFIFHRNTTFDQNTGRYSQVGSPITNASFDALGSNATIYSYDETEPYDTEEGLGLARFKTLEQMNITEMNPGSGYFSAFTGDVTGKIEFEGTPNTGIITYPLSLTDHPTAEDSFEGFNLLSNPYPSAISFTAFMSTNSSDIEGAIYLWDDFDSANERGTNDDYVVINGMGHVDSRLFGLSHWDGNIRSMQGFFVQAKSTGDLEATFNNDMKVTGTNSDESFYRIGERPSFKIVLSNEATYSETLIGEAEDASPSIDRYDAIRFGGSSPSINSLIDNQNYAIQGVPHLKESEVTLSLNNLAAGNYSLGLDEIKNLNGEMFILRDNYKNISVELTADKNYSFDHIKGQEHRFRVTIGGVISGLQADHSEWIVYQDQSGHIKIEAPKGESLQQVTMHSLSGQQIPLILIEESRYVRSNLSTSGVYIVQISTAQKTVSRRVIVKKS